MSTLLREGKPSVWRKTALTYGILAVFCGIVSVVYLQFSHGESSPFLVWLFAPSLVLGMVPALLMRRTRRLQRPGIAVRRVWNSAVASLTCGMLVRAVINISGRYTEYDTIFWVLSGVLFLAAVVIDVYAKGANNRVNMT